MHTGIIVKGVGSYYYVMDETGAVHECRMRGIFRKERLVPAVGDRVRFERSENKENLIVEIFLRESYLKRPSVANATQGVIVCALKQPDLNPVLLDKMLIQNHLSGLESLIAFHKADLPSEEDIAQIFSDYRDCGARLFLTSNQKQYDFESLQDALAGHITVFSGVSGAGKSTLLGMLSNREIETGSLSKIQRGKHTTRHSELIVLDPQTYLMDTPGFSDLELSISPDELWKYYPEFYDHSQCRFHSCLHLKEPGCNVKDAVENGLISQLRYENYVCIHNGLKKNYKPY